MPDYPIRRSTRLPGYDYASPGAYFVTVCTHERTCLFGEIDKGGVNLRPPGEIVWATWNELPRHFPDLEVDALVVMPNHLHGILALQGRGTACRAPTEAFGRPVSGSIPTIVRSFKSAAAREINRIRRTPGAAVWQRGYFEHIIRTPDDLNRLRRYIESNPLRWALDRENPANT
jgi:REP element-mobilizing transposase RayT